MTADGSTFGPHTGHVVTYVPFVEGMRKIVLAVKAASVPYFIMIGGTGSTILESEGVNCCDSRNFWVKVQDPLLSLFFSFLVPCTVLLVSSSLGALQSLQVLLYYPCLQFLFPPFFSVSYAIPSQSHG